MKIRRLKIDKMPGFPRGLREFSGFAGNINIIAGANGTGKSSTGRIIKRLIWWDRVSGIKADSEVEINERSHRIEIDHLDYIHIDCNQNRGSDDLSYLVPVNYADRYTLALHDLVKEDDRSLAEEIVREINGGVDLKKAVRELGYSDNIYNANIQQYKASSNADQRYRDLLGDQERLRGKLKQLETLKKERDDAEKAFKYIQFYSTYSSYLDNVEKLVKFQSELGGYDNALESLRSDDCGEVERLDRSIEDRRVEIERLKSEISLTQSQIEELLIPVSGVEESVIAELELSEKALQENENKIDALLRDIEHHKTALREAALAIDIVEDAPVKANYSLETLIEVEEFVREANTIHGEYRSLVERQERLLESMEEVRAEITIINPDSEKIRNGIVALSKWLQEGPGERGDMKSEMWSVAITGIVVIVATYFIGWWGLLGIIPIVVVTAILLSNIRKRAKSNISLRQEDYIGIGLEPILFWSREEVTGRIIHLMEQEKLLIDLKEMKAQEKRLNEQINRYNGQIEEYNQKFTEIVSKSGFASKGINFSGGDFNTFYYFIKRLQEWQSASVKFKSASNELEMLKTKETEIISKCNTLFVRSGLGEANGITSFEALLSTLKKQEENRRSLLTEKSHKTDLLERNIKTLGENEASVDLIYERLKLADRSRSYLRKLSGQLDEYSALKKSVETLVSLTKDQLQRLRASEFAYILSKNLSADESRLRQQRYEALYNRYGDIVEEISSIETQVRQKEGDNALERAIDDREQALASLMDEFEENLTLLTGSLVADQLQREISFNNDNRVFQEANRILGNITQNRYSLILSDSQFRAKDNTSSEILSLDELSTGTRVQLLLAIRLAFIHSFEKGERLPVIADELLANSDDMRSDAIINSLIEISRERQIFYFTAQSDEVSKWRSYLNVTEDISSQIYILGEGNSTLNTSISIGIERPEYLRPESDPVLLVRDIPVPMAFISRGEYFELLDVPTFNIVEQRVQELHLWYLIENLDILYDALRRGISTWGQLKAFHSNGGSIAGFDDALRLEIEQKTELLDRYGELYRIGRSKRIDKEVIERSGVISSVFRDSVSGLIEKAQGDPMEYLKLLGEIPRFRIEKVEELREYLISEEFIDIRLTLSSEELNIRLQAFVASIGLDPERAESFIRSLFQDDAAGSAAAKGFEEPLLFSLLMEN